VTKHLSTPSLTASIQCPNSKRPYTPL